MGKQAAGSASNFETCLKFFKERVDKTDECSDTDAAEIDKFIWKYDNAA